MSAAAPPQPGGGLEVVTAPARRGRVSARASALYDVPGPWARRRNLVLSVVGVGLALAGLWWVWSTLDSQGIFDERRWDVFSDPVTWQGLLRGLWATLRAAGVAAVLAAVLAIGVAAWRRASSRPLRWSATIVVELLRGVPVVLMMLFVLLVLRTSPFVAVVTGLTLYNAVVLGEILRAGLESLPRGQREAGAALGLRPVQVFTLIELPQALRTMLPSLVSQLVVLLKDTSLGFIVSYPELLRQVRTLSEFFGNRYLFSVFFVGAGMYLAVNITVSRFAAWLERRTARGR
ncbi:MAG: amino acid ABC transporter permease [Kineosporiaceae bacterium]